MRYSFDIKNGKVSHEVGVDAKSTTILKDSTEGTHPDSSPAWKTPLVFFEGKGVLTWAKAPENHRDHLMRILLVEDDRMIGEAITVALQDAAYAVDWVRDGETALRAIANQEHEAILLDLGLPTRDGRQVLRDLRATGSTLPIIIITARDALADRVDGLDLGADDYLVKPFEVDELLARLRAIIRRQGGQATPILSNGLLQLNLSTREVQHGDVQVLLTAREFALLQALLLRPGTILSRVQLEDRLYGWNETVESNTIDFLIHGIRKKLGAEAIKNVRGAGWMVIRQP